MVKLIIAGSRTVWPTIAEIDRAVSRLLDVSPQHFQQAIDEVISGTADGGDKAGEAWARHHHLNVRRMPANWREFGKIAGKMRNGEMSLVGDAACVFWDGVSNGSTDMVARMVERGKPVAVVMCEPVRKQSAQGALL